MPSSKSKEELVKDNTYQTKKENCQLAKRLLLQGKLIRSTKSKSMATPLQMENKLKPDEQDHIFGDNLSSTFAVGKSLTSKSRVMIKATTAELYGAANACIGVDCFVDLEDNLRAKLASQAKVLIEAIAKGLFQ